MIQHLQQSILIEPGACKVEDVLPRRFHVYLHLRYARVPESLYLALFVDIRLDTDGQVREFLVQHRNALDHAPHGFLDAAGHSAGDRYTADPGAFRKAADHGRHLLSRDPAAFLQVRGLAIYAAEYASVVHIEEGLTGGVEDHRFDRHIVNEGLPVPVKGVSFLFDDELEIPAGIHYSFLHPCAAEGEDNAAFTRPGAGGGLGDPERGSESLGDPHVASEYELRLLPD